MADTFSAHGDTCTIRSWDGGRLNTKAHGPGTLVDDDYGGTLQYTLNQGVISGYCWYTFTSGNKYAQVYNTQGMRHGTWVVFCTNGDICLCFYNNGNPKSDVQGTMCIQYIYRYNVLKDMRRIGTLSTCFN